MLYFAMLTLWNHVRDRIDGLVQDCSISSTLAMETPQSCTKPSCDKLSDNEMSYMDIAEF